MKLRKKCLLLLIVATVAITGRGLIASTDSNLILPAPQLMLPMYDHYAENWSSTAAAGRGHTVNAATGNIDTAVSNPANLIFPTSRLYLEMVIKPTLKAIDLTEEQKFASPIPFGMLGISVKLSKELNAGISYTMPKSILQDDFHIVMNQGTYWVIRYPSYNLHRITPTLNWDFGKMSMGINLHNQIHHFSDPMILHTFSRDDKTFYSLRVQPGVSYHDEQIKIGLSAILPTETEMKMLYDTFEVTEPLKVSGGIAYQYLNNGFYLDADWEQFSKMDEHFSDRLTIRGGMEKRIHNFVYRCGAISMPGVYSGSYLYPVYTGDDADTSPVWNDYPSLGFIKDTDQFFVTGGFSYYFKGGELSFALMQDFIGKVPTTRFLTSLGFDLSTFKRKRFLIFE